MSFLIDPALAAPAAPFTFGWDDTPGRTDESWGGFPNLSVGNAKTAPASGTINKLWVRAGGSGISSGITVRVNLYAINAAQDWSGILLATADFTGGFSADEARSVSITPVAITNGAAYGWAVQSDTNGINFASVNAGVNNQWWSDAFSDGPMNPGPNPTNNNGFARAPAVWGSN